MAQENKMTPKIVFAYFKETNKYIKSLYRAFEFEIRKKDEHVKNDIQFIGYYEKLNLSLCITYDNDNTKMVYNLEHKGHTIIHRYIDLDDMYHHIFLLADIVETHIKLEELYQKKTIDKYNHAVRAFKINKLI